MYLFNYLPSSRNVEIRVSNTLKILFGIFSIKLWLKSKIDSLDNELNNSPGKLVNQFPRKRKNINEVNVENISG